MKLSCFYTLLLTCFISINTTPNNPHHITPIIWIDTGSTTSTITHTSTPHVTALNCPFRTSTPKVHSIPKPQLQDTPHNTPIRYLHFTPNSTPTSQPDSVTHSTPIQFQGSLHSIPHNLTPQCPEQYPPHPSSTAPQQPSRTTLFLVFPTAKSPSSQHPQQPSSHPEHSSQPSPPRQRPLT